MDGRDQPQIKSVEEMIGRFTGELLSQVSDWKQRLASDSQQLEVLEKTIHQAFARGADMLVAGIIAIVMIDHRFEAASEKTRTAFSRPLQPGRERTVGSRLRGGLLIWATTLYCPPKKKRFLKDVLPQVGLNITLAQFGFGKGVSPALQSRVARQVALCPSIRFAHGEPLMRTGANPSW